MTVTSYEARYRLEIGDGWREPGEPAPEAITWFRRESYEHMGRIKEKEVTEEELRDAIAKYCPHLEDEILDLSGLTENVEIRGPQKTPRATGAVKRGPKALKPPPVAEPEPPAPEPTPPPAAEPETAPE